MEDLIEALGILKKYLKTDYNRKYPTACEHDVFMVIGLDFSQMTIHDARRLYDLGFILGTDWDERPKDIVDVDDHSTDEEWERALDFAKENYGVMSSYKYGSC